MICRGLPPTCGAFQKLRNKKIKLFYLICSQPEPFCSDYRIWGGGGQLLPSHSQHIRTAIAFSLVPPPACTTQLQPHTCPAPPYPTSTTHPLHKNYPLHHALAKTEPIQLGFRNFVPNTLSRLHRSTPAIHPLNITLSHPNNIPPMQKQPPPPCINEN